MTTTCEHPAAPRLQSALHAGNSARPHPSEQSLLSMTWMPLISSRRPLPEVVQSSRGAKGTKGGSMRANQVENGVESKF